MAKLRESVISNCEKKFIIKSLEEYMRLDGRSFDEFRDLKIQFGRDWGCCHVALGKTRVVAQVSCEVQEPNSSRPSEGILNLNIELNPMGAPHFEAGRQSELSVQLNRTLEKCLKDSKAVDLESLCIKVKEKVWAFRVDINVLNHEGNLLDCASVAALSALAHFRRPDVTCDGEETVIHTYAQRDPIPTVIHHHPICVSYAIFNEGATVLADPTLLEEGVSEGHLIVGLNAYKELCALHLGGSARMTPEVILQCTSKAAARAKIVVEQIKRILQEDKDARIQKKDVGFEHSLHFDEEENTSYESLTACLDKWTTKSQKKKIKVKAEKEEMKVDEKPENGLECGGVIESLGKGSAVLLPQEKGTCNSVWTACSSEEEEDDDDDVVILPTKTEKPEEIDISSEEETVVVLNADRQTNKRRKHT